MIRISELHGADKTDKLAVPWHVNPGLAFRFAKRDQRRIVVVPAPGGKVNPVLEKALSDQQLLHKYHRCYSYMKLDPAIAMDVGAKLKGVGDTGFLICDAPPDEMSCGWTGDGYHPLPKIREVVQGPHPQTSLMQVLAKHAVPADAPTWTELRQARLRRERGR